VDVTVRFRGSIVSSRRLGGRRPDATTPFRGGLLAIAIGMGMLVLQLAVGYDPRLAAFEPIVLGGALVGIGLVALVVGLQRAAEPDREAFWMGPASDVDIALDRPDIVDRLAVVSIAGHDVEVRPPRGFVVCYDGTELPRENVMRLGPRSELTLRDDEIEIELRRAAPTDPPPRLGRIDARFVGGVALATLAIGGTIMIAHYVVPDPMSIDVPPNHTAHGIERDLP
jgi:hypothetical protein